MLGHDVVLILVDMMIRNASTHAACRIDIGPSSDAGTWVKYAVTANFYMIAQHSTKLLKTCFALIIRCCILDYNKLLVTLNIGCDRTCAHMCVVSKDRVSNIVVMRNLNLVKKNYVLKLSRVAYYSSLAHDSITSNESALADFSIFIDDTIVSKIC
jgi:hypothetical protein